MKTKLLTLLLTATCFLTASAAELKPYRIGYNNWIGYIALFVAEEKGFFKDEGLAVTKTSFSAPGDGLKPLLGGDLDAHFTTVDSVIIALDKAAGKVKVVYLTDTSAGADAIVAKKEIADVKGLKGKKVAATTGECNQLLLLEALKQAGMKESDIEMTNMNPDDSGAAFAAGRLDAAVTWEPWISQVEAEKKGHVIFSSKDVPNLILDCVAISDETAAKKREETKAFLRALNKANELVISDPALAAQLAAKAIEMKPADIEGLLPKVKLYGKEDNLKEMGGGALPTTKKLAAFFQENKVNSGLVDASTVFDSSFLK